MNKSRLKIQSKKGTSLAETLAAVLIMSLTGLISVTAVLGSSGAYGTVLKSTEADLLLSANINMVTASVRKMDLEEGVEIIRDSSSEKILKVVFTSRTEGYRGYYQNSDEGICFVSELENSSGEPVFSKNIVSERTATGSLCAKLEYMPDSEAGRLSIKISVTDENTEIISSVITVSPDYYAYG